MTDRKARKPKLQRCWMATSLVTTSFFIAKAVSHSGTGWDLVIALVCAFSLVSAAVETARAVLLEHREASKPKPIDIRL